MFRLRSILICTALLLASQLGSAQTQIFRGRSVVAATQAPLVGALVQLRRPGGEIVTTTTTSESGNFSVSGLSAGSYFVRILRIGFRPFDAGNVTITDGAPAILNVAWNANPIPLATRLVKADRACKISADSGTLIANVWEETRKALLSSMIAEQSEAPDIERVTFERYVDTTGVIIKQDVSIDRFKTFRAYTSWAPDSLALNGYVIVDGNTYAMVGPDASTLFSDSFAGTHCFELTDDVAGHANEIGLTFTPVKSNNKQRVDIAGTFWVDRATWGLRSVEYWYEGSLFDSESRLAGNRRAAGVVEFGSLATGQWLVTNWRIARPIVDGSYQFPFSNGAQVRVVGKGFVAGIDESGGFVTRVSHNNATQLRRSLPELSIQLASRDPQVSVAGAQIRITGVDTVFTPDQNGRLRLPGFLDGKYRVSTTFPSIASFARVAVDRVVTISAADVLDSIHAPSMETVVRTGCGPKADFTTRSALVGTLSVNQQRKPGVTLVLQWPVPGRSPSAMGEGGAVAVRSTVTNGDGRFLVCEVPRGLVVVQAPSDVASQEYRLTLNGTGAIRYVAIDLPPPTELAAHKPTANVEVQLLDANNQPVSKKIRVANVLGASFQVTTDKFGIAVLQDQPEGPLTLTVDKQPPMQQVLVPGYNLVRFVMTKR